MSNITISNKAQLGQEPSLFKSRWDTTQAGSANDTVVLPLVSDGSYNFDVDWGDGNRDNITVYNQSEVTHQYSNTGIYEIRIKGDITGWYFGGAGDDDKIINISEWGSLRFVSNDTYIFYGCSNLVLSATDSLTLSDRNGEYTFYNCPKLGDQGNMNSWDTSSSTNMREMFRGATDFNQSISDWDTSNVTTMYYMFRQASNFNNGGSPGISGWDTSKVTNMAGVFNNSSFNQPIGSWNTSKVTDMYTMFQENTSFNQDIGNWDVSGVTRFGYMFYGGTNFNNGGSSSISGWDTSSLVGSDALVYTFHGTAFNQDIGNWNMTGVTALHYTFTNSSFNNGGSPSISGWDTSNITSMQNTFRNSDFNQPIGAWDVSNVTTMHFMFNRCFSLNQDFGNWDVSNLTDANGLFRECRKFTNGGSNSITGWDVSKVTTFRTAFQSCTGFNIPIGVWDTSSLTNIEYMLYGTNSFDQDLSNWIVTGITAGNQFMGAASISTTNYDSTLSGWSSQSVQNGVNMTFGSSKYSTATGLAYRNALVSAGWTITDGGAA